MKSKKLRKVLILLSGIFILSCDSDSNSDAPELSLSDSLIGVWTLSGYYYETFFEDELRGRIEKEIIDETDYEIEFLDNPKKIVLRGLLRYSVEEYEIVEGDKVITSEHINFMEASHGEGYHTNEWRIEDGILITQDHTGDGGEPYISKSEILLSGNNLKLILDPSQFNADITGEIIIDYSRK